MQVTPLLRELIVRATAFAQPYAERGREARLARVLADEIAAARVAPFALPAPRDARLLRITRRLLDDPADDRTLAAWGRAAGASPRTLARLFRRETGMSFARWRQQARLLRALELLAAGRAVTEVALDLGYESTSAFITMFRETLGSTPARYFSAAPPAAPDRSGSSRSRHAVVRGRAAARRHARSESSPRASQRRTPKLAKASSHSDSTEP